MEGGRTVPISLDTRVARFHEKQFKLWVKPNDLVPTPQRVELAAESLEELLAALRTQLGLERHHIVMSLETPPDQEPVYLETLEKLTAFAKVQLWIRPGTEPEPEPLWVQYPEVVTREELLGKLGVQSSAVEARLAEVSAGASARTAEQWQKAQDDLVVVLSSVEQEQQQQIDGLQAQVAGQIDGLQAQVAGHINQLMTVSAVALRADERVVAADARLGRLLVESEAALRQQVAEAASEGSTALQAETGRLDALLTELRARNRGAEARQTSEHETLQAGLRALRTDFQGVALTLARQQELNVGQQQLATHFEQIRRQSDEQQTVVAQAQRRTDERVGKLEALVRELDAQLSAQGSRHSEMALELGQKLLTKATAVEEAQLAAKTQATEFDERLNKLENTQANALGDELARTQLVKQQLEQVEQVRAVWAAATPFCGTCHSKPPPPPFCTHQLPGLSPLTYDET